MLTIWRTDRIVWHHLWGQIIPCLLLGVSLSALIAMAVNYSQIPQLTHLLGLSGDGRFWQANGLLIDHPSFARHWTLAGLISLIASLERWNHLKQLAFTSGYCSDEFFSKVQQSLRNVPPRVSRYLAFRGYRVYVAHNLAVLTSDADVSLGGACYKQLRMILIAEEPRTNDGSPDSDGYEAFVLGHEIGHAVDFSVHGSDSLLFADHYNADRLNLSETAFALLPFCIRSETDYRSELFAELFSSISGMSCNPFLEETFPRCTQYVRNKFRSITK